MMDLVFRVEEFGVPLHTNDEATLWHLERLDAPIRRMGGRDQSGRHNPHCLVVQAVHAQIGLVSQFQNPMQPRPRHDCNTMGGRLRLGFILTMQDFHATLGRQILPEGTTHSDAENLATPAQRKNWDVSFDCPSHQWQLERVHFRRRFNRLVDRDLPVLAGINVWPTREDQAVNPVQ